MASQVLSTSLSLINAHSARFVDLSAIFLLPLAFFLSTIAYPAFLDFYPNPFSVSLTIPTIPDMTVLTFITFLLFLISSLCAVGSVTHRAFHGLRDRPVALYSAIKSGLASFFPLLGTLVVSQMVVLSIFISFGLFLSLGVGVMEEFWSAYFRAVSAAGLFALLLYLQVMWSLAFAVVVVESKWVFGALIRSWGLVCAMRLGGVVSCLMVLSGALSSILGLFSWLLEVASESTAAAWKSWATAVLLAVTTILQMAVLLYYAVAITIVYCKAAGGGGGEEVSNPMDYVKLDMGDDELVSASVVSVLIPLSKMQALGEALLFKKHMKNQINHLSVQNMEAKYIIQY
ncbi:uncharacterized protein [Pyrus communis]|uniref:uncharacterized protein n=1 Tax=Pyrus communis TaxID=23211 RepID=UPI0035BF3171